MYKRKPEGYKELLSYKRAVEVHDLTLKITAQFPKTKTMVDLADQMSRSARSDTKNIVEGYNRNTTAEYFQFLGFSIGSNTELMEDAADVATGKYKDLMGIKGIMGERGAIARADLDRLPFYPLPPSLPLIVQLFLKCKEVNFLLYRLQQSLDVKMNTEGTKSQMQKLKEHKLAEKQDKDFFEQLLKQHGLTRNADGRIIEN